MKISILNRKITLGSRGLVITWLLKDNFIQKKLIKLIYYIKYHSFQFIVGTVNVGYKPKSWK